MDVAAEDDVGGVDVEQPGELRVSVVLRARPRQGAFGRPVERPRPVRRAICNGRVQPCLERWRRHQRRHSAAQPLAESPVDVTAIVDAYAEWLKTSNVPKLFLKAEPGGILAGGKVLEQARSFPVQTEVTVKGIHFVQEDSPDEIGQATANWLKALG